MTFVTHVVVIQSELFDFKLLESKFDKKIVNYLFAVKRKKIEF